MPQLQFDYAPSTANIGEEFTVAVILVDEDGNPAEDVEDITAAVSLTALDDGVVLEGAEPVELGFGEAMFDAVKIVQAPGDLPSGMTALVASCEGFDPMESELFDVTGVAGAEDGGEDDEDLLDIAKLAQRLSTAKGAKVKHYLMLIKGRLWAKPENATEILSCDLMGTIVRVMHTCDTDEAIECVGIVQELLTNPTGQVLHSCASCRSTIRVGETDNKVFVTSTGLVFHEGCLVCTKCKTPIGGNPFVRDERLKPWHIDCPKEDNVKVLDEAPMQCTELPPPEPLTETSKLAPCVEAFLENGDSSADAFVIALQKNHRSDEYVDQRVKRMLARIPPPVMKRSLAIQGLA